MKKSFGRRLIEKHGLTSNILKGLELTNQLLFANICKRTYNMTVPWNIAVEADKYVSVFPMIDDITDDFICKVTQTTIQGKKGEFYGSVRKSTGLPSGEGVFVTDKWIFFGRVMDGKCFVGETLRIRRDYDPGEYWIINAKLKADGTLLEKV
jgi:hypothetical protein